MVIREIGCLLATGGPELRQASREVDSGGRNLKNLLDNLANEFQIWHLPLKCRPGYGNPNHELKAKELVGEEWRLLPQQGSMERNECRDEGVLKLVEANRQARGKETVKPVSSGTCDGRNQRRVAIMGRQLQLADGAD